MDKHQLCAICGVRPATTRDHVPPAAVFPKPRPSDLVTVPCCRPCNNDASRWDERFAVYLSLHVSRHEPGWLSKSGKSVLRTTRHNQRLLRQILESSEDVMLRTPAGLLLGPAVKVRWDSEAHDKVVERTIRGLHFHHTGEILGNRAHVKVQFLDSLKGVATAFDCVPLRSIGDGQMLYRVMYHPELPLQSAWLFEFRGSMWSGGSVTPVSKDSVTGCA